MRRDGRQFEWLPSAERIQLRALFTAADALVADISCDASTDCCRFGVTGREPYVTAAEVAEIRVALRAKGGARPSKSPVKQAKRTNQRLPMVDERRCPLLSDEGRCGVYDARPLGCRTFFCQPALAKSGGVKLPHADLRQLAREVEEISRQAFPREPGTRPPTRILT